MASKSKTEIGSVIRNPAITNRPDYEKITTAINPLGIYAGI